MSCCGKTKSIVKGYTKLATDTVGLTEKYEFTDSRIRTCHNCDEQTWMLAGEYAAWSLRYGIKVLANFSQLEKLPKLPKYKQDRNRRMLYCRICKCFIPAKARVKEKKCPLNKWQLKKE